MAYQCGRGPDTDLMDAHVLLARLRIRADQPSAELAARVITALRRVDPDFTPTLRHDDAAAIGTRLAHQWDMIVGEQVPDAGDMVWADLVQFVLRYARERADEVAALGAAPL